MPTVSDVLDHKKHPDGVHRDQWSRPIYIIPDDPEHSTRCTLCGNHVHGWPYTRMTRFIDVLEDKYRLEKWIQRQVLKGVVLKEHIVIQASGALNDEDPGAERDALDKLCDEAAQAAGSRDKAKRGTGIHTLIERRAEGKKPRIPASVKADLAAYDALIDEHGLVVAEFEINIVIDGVQVQKTAKGIGGRFDLVYQLPHPCPQCGKLHRIGDLKTGRVDYGAGKFSMQLAGYALGQRYDARTGERNPIDVCQCHGYVIHLPAGEGKADLHKVDLAQGRAGLGVAYNVWNWRDNSGSMQHVTKPEAPPQEKGAHIHGLISVAADWANLAGLWEYFTQRGEWTEEHTLAAKQRLAQLEQENTDD